METIDPNEEILVWPDWLTAICLLYYTIDVHAWSVGWTEHRSGRRSVGWSVKRTNKRMMTQNRRNQAQITKQ